MTPLVDPSLPSPAAQPPDVRFFPVVEFKIAEWMPLPDPVASLSIADLLPDHSPALSIAIGLQPESLLAPDSLTKLDELVDRAQAIDPSYRPRSFKRVLRVRTHDVSDARVLADALRDAPGIDFAIVQQAAPLPAVNPANDPLAVRQVQLDPPSRGVNARAAWLGGADGSGVSIVDVEFGFDPHVAVPTPTMVYMVPGTPVMYGQHGAAVLGILSERDDAQGGIGLAPGSNVGFAARFGPMYGDEHLGDALTAAAYWLSFGDVVLLELQWSAEINGDTFVTPLEVHPFVRGDMLPLFRRLGITVIEGAGNDRLDLALVIKDDSGAVIVGGVNPVTNTRVDLERLSNFGDRVNCHARYAGIVTTGWEADLPGSGPKNSPTAYTGSFGGTSATSAIVAGAACLLQSYVVKTLGYRLSPSQMRRVLSIHGSLSGNPPVDRVGRMPDLGLCVREVDKERVFWIRSAQVERQGTPRSEWGTCPDIRVIPPLSRGPGIPPFPEPPPGPKRRQIFVSAAYMGLGMAHDVTARVYLAPPVSLPRTEDWVLLGHAWIGSIPGDGAFHECAAPLVWDLGEDPPFGGYTLIAIVENKGHRGQAKEGIRTAEELERFFLKNRNVGVLTVLEPSRRIPVHGQLAYAFQVEGGRNGEATEVLVRHDLPSGVRVRLVVPAALAQDRPADPDGRVRVDVARLEPLTLSVRANVGRDGPWEIEVEAEKGTLLAEGGFTVLQRVGDGPVRRMIGQIPSPTEEATESVTA